MCNLPRGSLEVRRCSPQRSPTVHSGQDCGVQLQARGEHVHHHSACITETLQPLLSILLQQSAGGDGSFPLRKSAS